MSLETSWNTILLHLYDGGDTKLGKFENLYDAIDMIQSTLFCTMLLRALAHIKTYRTAVQSVVFS